MSVVCTCADASDREALRALWMLAFPDDTAADIDAFFDRFFSGGQALVVKDDGRVVSMLFLLPATFEYDKKRSPVGYIYAGATHPDVREKGHYRQLLRFARQESKRRGMAALLLRPANEALAQSYRRMGFTVPLTCDSCAGESLQLSALPPHTPLAAREYGAARRCFLRESGVPFIDWEDRVFEQALSWCRAVQIGEGGYALYAQDRNDVMIWELFCEDLRFSANVVCAYCDAHGYKARTPGNEMVLGLLDPIDPTVFSHIPPVYMGYGLE